MLYQSTATYKPFQAASQKEAVLIALNELAAESGGTCELVSVDHEGDHSACLATITTKAKGWQEGEQAEQETTEQRRFMVKPHRPQY